MKGANKVSQAKIDVVNRIKDFAKQYKYVGILNFEDLPAMQLQTMKKNLHGKVLMYMAKKRLIKIALDELKDDKPHLIQLSSYLNGMVALVFTNDNPFTFYKVVEKNKSPAPAKPGQIAPKDIIIKSGKTTLLPGPIIGELGKFGVKTLVEGGKLAIKDDKVVCKEGDVISGPLATILSRLSILPMQLGLSLNAIVDEDGLVYTSKDLHIDVDAYKNDVITAATQAFNLSCNANIFNKDSIQYFLFKAGNQSFNLAVESNIMTKETKELIISKCHNAAVSIKGQLNI